MLAEWSLWALELCTSCSLLSGWDACCRKGNCTLCVGKLAHVWNAGCWGIAHCLLCTCEHLCLSKQLTPCGCAQIPNEFLTFRDTRTEVRHPIRLYSRYINKVRHAVASRREKRC